MAKKTCKSASKPRPKGPWPAVLVEMAAVARDDGGVGLNEILHKAGFSEKPSMTIIVKRPPRRSSVSDPAVDDVLDALRALCA